MPASPSPAGAYKGFRVTGALLREMARVDASVSGAVRTADEGFLGHAA